MSDSKPLRLFCSYSHKDEAYLNELRTWLRRLERQGFIEWWHDREISPGWEWEEAIDKNLRTADIILLLVTPDFMASDYVFEKEIDRAVERHERGEARVIPIIVRPADWEGAQLDRLQMLPKDAKPITTWLNWDEAWLDVERGIRKAVDELLRERHEQAATEAAKRKAKELSVDLSLVEGSGTNGRITVKDVVGAAKFLNRTVPRTSEESAVAERTQEPPARSIITASNGRRVGLLRTLEDWGIISVAFSPDGKLIALGTNDNKVRLWQVEDGMSLRTTLEEPPDQPPDQDGVWSVAFSPDGKLLASGAGGDEIVRLWRVEDGELLRTLAWHSHQAGVRSVAFSPDGKLLAASSNVEAVRLWRVEDGELLRTLVHEMLNGVAFSPSGKLLATVSGDATMRLWRVEDGVSLRTLEDRSMLTSVAFSPDGKLLATGASKLYRGLGGNYARLWRVEDGEMLRTLEGHGAQVDPLQLSPCVAFSPDGELLAFGSDDNKVQLWRVEDGASLRTLEGHTDQVDSVGFSPDGSLLVSGSLDGSVRLWGIA